MVWFHKVILVWWLEAYFRESEPVLALLGIFWWRTISWLTFTSLQSTHGKASHSEMLSVWSLIIREVPCYLKATVSHWLQNRWARMTILGVKSTCSLQYVANVATTSFQFQVDNALCSRTLGANSRCLPFICHMMHDLILTAGIRQGIKMLGTHTFLAQCSSCCLYQMFSSTKDFDSKMISITWRLILGFYFLV